VAGWLRHTDENRIYNGLRDLDYHHETINHSLGEYVRDGVSTNSIEAVWAVLKRGIYGTFHHVSEKHLDRYVKEFTFRLNEGNVERHTLQRLESFVDGLAELSKSTRRGSAAVRKTSMPTSANRDGKAALARPQFSACESVVAVRRCKQSSARTSRPWSSLSSIASKAAR
jgi:hypothetical protein